MQLRHRLTLTYTLLVGIILLIVCVGINLFSIYSRLNTIKSRLENTCITTVERLFKVDDMDTETMFQIDRVTRLTLTQKSVAVYDVAWNSVYAYSDPGIPAAITNDDLRKRLPIEKKIYFPDNERDAIAIVTSSEGQTYYVIAEAHDTIGRAHLSQLRTILLIVFFGGILLTYLTVYFFSGNILQRIDRIISEVNLISRGNLERRLVVGNNKDELERLAATVNLLLERLKNSFETQSRFIANASHELSTPLTSISNELEVTMQQERSAEEYAAVLRSVYEDVQHLNKLTHALLDLAKASGTPEGVKLEPVRIDELLLDLPLMLKRVNAVYAVNVHMEEAPAEERNLLVFGNRELLYSAVSNVVTNACKFGTDHAAFINLRFTDTDIIITITNRGKVIPPSEAENIFQPFYRSNEPDKPVPGTGLGLSLTHRIIRLHNGHISLQSKDEQTTFEIVLKCTEG